MTDLLSGLYRLGHLVRNFYETNTALSIKHYESGVTVVTAEKNSNEAMAAGYDLCTAVDKVFKSVNHERSNNSE